MVQTTDYLAKIAPEHAGKPKFVATVGLSVDPLTRMQAALFGLVQDFDFDSAVGVQLDAVGVRVGLSRLVPYALQGLFFSFDDPLRGLDEGVWKGPYDVGTSLYSLDDDTYRRLLVAKRLANAWDGTVDGEEAILASYFTNPATLVFVSDDANSAQPKNYFTFDDPLRGLDQGEWAPAGPVSNTPTLSSVDMRMTIGFAGKIPSPIDLAILDQGLVGAKPEGVTVDYAVTSVDGSAIFGLDMANSYVAGFDTGAWAVTPGALIGATGQPLVPGSAS
ncbi:MAG: DUF2612 domain-containing protein [Bradyrhizobium sp.]|nr:DUF2612 domain-containing protein [Bradyrhizobium sp.]